MSRIGRPGQKEIKKTPGDLTRVVGSSWNTSELVAVVSEATIN